ncbi:hypothetical protein RRV45_20495 [Bacillus sp. DTU_2020_1000418_1_SI_GHA_SEK_038]|uniref:hypothetical protein n=1 Tax=Bacillus sp. DTU_2020_1000418_1_SI_GHA_SEK_038 TaxID=3077585 RepID=UPI0028EDE91B|nr:hypothetical protein [Bacillus sp. DTU_2020_1000418_1_SI_GHA_SEK_038]WNS75224.1 hypothetical protein RRV45_20495 [Bacillus sp. DTU_2020_1000418_1_SI_GHA_SEK_038]
MAKKALINTFIFTLIIINLIIWPMLFSEFKEDNKAAGEQGKFQETVMNEDSHNTTETESNSEVTELGEESEVLPQSNDKEENIFKILRIE